MTENTDLKLAFLRKNGPFGPMQCKDIIMYCINVQQYFGYYTWEFENPYYFDVFKTFLNENEYIIQSIRQNIIQFSVPNSWYQ